MVPKKSNYLTFCIRIISSDHYLGTSAPADYHFVRQRHQLWNWELSYSFSYNDVPIVKKSLEEAGYFERDIYNHLHGKKKLWVSNRPLRDTRCYQQLRGNLAGCVCEIDLSLSMPFLATEDSERKIKAFGALPASWHVVFCVKKRRGN